MVIQAQRRGWMSGKVVAGGPQSWTHAGAVLAGERSSFFGHRVFADAIKVRVKGRSPWIWGS